MTIGRIPSVEGGIQPTIVDAKGDLIAATAADTVTRFPLGSNGQVLKVNTSTETGLEWATDSSGMTNPMTTTGDTIYSSSGSTPARLAIGSTGQVLTVSGGVPTWATPAGGGKLLQMVTATGNATTIASTSTTDTGLSATITPTSASSKILIMVSQPVYVSRSAAQTQVYMGLYRSTTEIKNYNDAYRYSFTGSTAATTIAFLTFQYVDSPNTTSATTYKTRGALDTTSNSQTSTWSIGDTGRIILLEIGA